jgi:serine/threonine-protein kinase RsbW
VTCGEGESCLCVTIAADQDAVSEALVALYDRLLLRSLPDSARDAAQIVLAEALNNIVEHAYASGPGGEIELTLWRDGPGLSCRIVDAGAPMPDGRLPSGTLPAVDGPITDLPEGGFGWHLIRVLSQDLAYFRSGERNTLTFRVAPSTACEQ